ncbi:MAG: hypothetical protein ACI9SI_001523 [Polaribacter sp.]|jgi:hypothetical protein
MLKKTFYIFLLIISIKSYGQRSNSSPYSFFGIGQQYSSQSAEQASMGGVGVAFSNIYHLNFINPASFSNLRFATYSVGMRVNDLTVKDFSGSQKSTSTSLSYINIGFPVSKNSGVAFGLRPNTSVGYSLLNIVNDSNGDAFESTRSYGSGGTSTIYGAFGISVFKDFNVGLEAEYVFGKTENNVLSQRAGVHLATKNHEKVTIKGAGLKVGILYKKEFSNKIQMNLGASFKLESDLTTTGTEHLYSLSVESSGIEVSRDTLHSTSIAGKLKIPLKSIFGIGFGKENKWYAALDYEFQNPINVQNTLLASSSAYAYGTSNRLSIGGFYLPKVNSISSYWHRVTYRAGVRFEDTGLLINTSSSGGFTKVNDFGISFGLGLPLRSTSNLNLGVEYGKKGTTMNNLIQENYFNFKLSLSLNAVGNLAWFQKRKID